MERLPRPSPRDFAPRLRWERALADTAFISTMQTRVQEADDDTFEPKHPAHTTVSIVTCGSFKRAVARTDGLFDPVQFGREFLAATDFSGLLRLPAYVEEIGFLQSIRNRQGLRLALFFRSEVDNEQRAAHNLLLAKSLADRPYLAGSHISIGNFSHQLAEGLRREIIAHVSTSIPGEFQLLPIAERRYSESAADAMPGIFAAATENHSTASSTVTYLS